MSATRDVLVVDDDEDMLEILVLVLGGAGYATRIARHGGEALDAAAEALPGLILLDMLMPVMDGWAFVEEFRARYGGEVPIVVLTAAEHARARCSSIDVSAVLTKPFDVPELLRVVARHLAPAREA